MNLRILKKLSKRAAPLLPLLGETREQFKAEKGDSYTGVCNIDWKHRERWTAKHPSGRYRTYLPRHGKHHIMFYTPAHPFKGTIMVGSMCGYYEPEWEEETAWEALCDWIFNHFTTWSEDGCVLLRDLSTPTLIFKAAHEMVSAIAKEQGRC